MPLSKWRRTASKGTKKSILDSTYPRPVFWWPTEYSYSAFTDSLEAPFSRRLRIMKKCKMVRKREYTWLARHSDHTIRAFLLINPHTSWSGTLFTSVTIPYSSSWICPLAEYVLSCKRYLLPFPSPNLDLFLQTHPQDISETHSKIPPLSPDTINVKWRRNFPLKIRA